MRFSATLVLLPSLFLHAIASPVIEGRAKQCDFAASNKGFKDAKEGAEACKGFISQLSIVNSPAVNRQHLQGLVTSSGIVTRGLQLVEAGAKNCGTKFTKEQSDVIAQELEAQVQDVVAILRAISDKKQPIQSVLLNTTLVRRICPLQEAQLGAFAALKIAVHVSAIARVTVAQGQFVDAFVTTLATFGARADACSV